MSNPLAPDWLVPPADPNALDQKVWPAHARRDDDGVLRVGGVSASRLVEQYGSPLYVVDLDEVVQRARSLEDTLTSALAHSGRTLRIHYATKALLAADVIRALDGLGWGFDVSSFGEWEWTRRAGANPAHIEYQGNNKSVHELRAAISHGVGQIVIDSAIEVERLAAVTTELGVTQDVMIRVNTGVHAGTHEYLATAREDQKFGVARADIPALAADIARHPSLRLIGLHSHIGSQIVAPDGFVEATKRVLELYKTLQAHHPLTTLNIGGGFAIPYTSADPESNLEDIAQAVGHEIDEFVAREGITLDTIACEPGRYVVGPAGVTLYSVGTTKPVEVDYPVGDESDEESGVATRLYVSVDGGMSDNLRPALYGANYTARIANRASSAPPALVRVVGSHCESGDIVIHDDYLPADVTPGDLVAVAATGAYCHSLSSNYNALGRPALVVIEGGEARVAIQSETPDDVMARDLGLALGSLAADQNRTMTHSNGGERTDQA